MNRLLAILLLICLALPGAGWARPVVEVGAVCASETAAVMAGAAEEEHCGCCERTKQCGCEVKRSEEAPGRPVPAAPPRTVSAGEPVFVAPPTAPYDFAVADTGPVRRDAIRPLGGCGRAMGRTVPTRILHCSRLC